MHTCHYRNELVAAVHECTKCRLKSNHEIAGVSLAPPALLPSFHPPPSVPRLAPRSSPSPYRWRSLRDREATRYVTSYLEPRGRGRCGEFSRGASRSVKSARNSAFLRTLTLEARLGCTFAHVLIQNAWKQAPNTCTVEDRS